MYAFLLAGEPLKPYYQQDGITIYHADCLEVLPEVSADLVVTSPPYNCGMNYGGHNDLMPVRDYFSWLESRYAAMARATSPGGFVCLNVPSWIGSREEQVFAFDEYKAICDRHVRFYDLIVWAKSPPNGTAWGNYPTAPRIRANHEWVLVHKAEGKAIGPSDIGWDEWARLTQSVWTINPLLPYRDEHPATFPGELVRRLLMLFSPAKGTVLDPFMGSGTTLAVARGLGRSAIGIEVNERYCEIAAKRLSQGLLEFSA